MALGKLVLAREFGLGVGMTLFLCLAPQSSAFFTGALFVGMFTIYETFPEFHWVPAWTLYKIVAKEEDPVQGAVRVAVQFGASTLAAIIGYQLLATDVAATYPTFAHDDDWRSFLWAALIWGAWLGLTNHGNKKEDGTFRRNFALTATFCSANYILQGIAGDCILNSAVNFGRTIGAQIYYKNSDRTGLPASPVEMEKLWLVICSPLVGVMLAYVFLKLDDKIAAWDAPAADKDETTAVYGSTGDNAAGDKEDEIIA